MNEFFETLLYSQTRVVSFETMVTALVCAFICSAIIFTVYRFFYKGVVYSGNFNVLLVIVCMVSSLLILTVTTNLTISLGVLGALSIIRFRSAIKDPLDVGFLFLSVAAGLASGAGLYLVALCGVTLICLIIVILVKLPVSRRVYLMVVTFEGSAPAELTALLKQHKAKLKNKTIRKGSTELTAEVKLRNKNENLPEAISAIEGVSDVVFVEYSGDYAQ